MKTPRWKVRKLPDGRWLAHHSACAARDHLCFRWLYLQPRCVTRPTLPEAYQEAAHRYRLDAYEYQTVQGIYYEPIGPNHVHVWSRIWGEAGTTYVGCTLCGKPRW